VKAALPTTGTSELLEEISAYIPDEFINEQWPDVATGGRRHLFSAAQLWRVHLLLLLTPAHSNNLLSKLLAEHRSWRRFARLSHRHRVPDVRMLNEFRARVGVSGLRAINRHLLTPLLSEIKDRADTIAIIDATDLPAACKGFKKSKPASIQPSVRPPVIARLKPARVSGTRGIRSTPCGSGWCSIKRQCCWFP
jgi:hypothetical protein